MSESKKEELRYLSGLLILLLQSADIVNRKLDIELHKVHMRVQRELKKTCNDSLALSQKLSKRLECVTELGINCGDVNGKTDACEVYDAMMQDSGEILHLLMEFENARKFDDLALLKLVSYAKTLVKGEQVFSSELIADILPKI